MKILHTADIHLRDVGDNRWRALEGVVELARRHGAGLIVIAGDMFDRRIDAQKLKVPLRDLFEGADARVFVLPGNHDVRALCNDDYYGEKVTVLTNPRTYVDVEGVRVFGLPFERLDGEGVLERLMWIRGHLREDACHILLYHGELLDMVYKGDGYGDEGGRGYMPARLSFFDRLGIDYVLAGHFHSNFEVQRYDGGYFVYPGSPVSITKKETGPRCVNVFEPGEPPQRVGIDTEHFQEVTVPLNPFSMSDPIEEIRAQIDRCPPHARILLTVTGFVDLGRLGKSESEFAAEIGALKTDAVDTLSSHWTDIGRVVENELFRRFLRRLDDSDTPEERRKEIREMVIESMVEALHAS